LRILWNKGRLCIGTYDPGLYTSHQQWACLRGGVHAYQPDCLPQHPAVSRTVPDTETTMPAGPHDWSVYPIFIGYDAPRALLRGRTALFNGAYGTR